MATSSALSTTNEYIKYKITITQNSQNVANNTSNVTVSVKFYRTNTGYTTYGSGTVYCKINGTKYSASVDSDDKITNSGIVLFTKTLNITHNSDGTKTLATSAWISHSRVDSNEQSYSQTLTTIPRKSTLSVGNGTLGTAQTLTVTRQSTSFTHTITYECGSASGTIVTKSTSTSISFTPPLSLASQNTSGTSVSITYTITTYSGNTSIGSNSYTKTCSIPSSVVPTISSVTITEATSGLADKFGAYIQNKSKLKVVISASGVNGSTISSYTTEILSKSYSGSTITSAVIGSSGSVSIKVTVKDSRGRTATTTKTVTVLAYSDPKITSFTVVRCDSDGTENDEGDYVKVTYAFTITSLNNLNSKTATVGYKLPGNSSYTTLFGSLVYSESTTYTSTAVFDGDNSYDFRLAVGDYFKTIYAYDNIASSFSLVDYHSSGKGMAIGKVAEIDGILDIGLPVKFSGGSYSKPRILWSGGYYMSAGHTIALSQKVSEQVNGIVLVFSRYSNDTAQNYHFNSFFVHKDLVSAQSGNGHSFIMTTGNNFDVIAMKYLYIHDDKIGGNDNNVATGTGASGITYANNGFVLRYVLGV